MQRKKETVFSGGFRVGFLFSFSVGLGHVAGNCISAEKFIL